MNTVIHKAAVAVAAVTLLASTALAAPPATQYQSTLTNPTGVIGATIKITKSSKVQIKASGGTVTFTLKLNGVTDAGDVLVNLASNTFQVDVLRPNGALSTVMFNFDIVNGKLNQKFPVAIGSFPGGALNPGEPIDIRRVRLVQAGNGNDFAVAGLTIK